MTIKRYTVYLLPCASDERGHNDTCVCNVCVSTVLMRAGRTHYSHAQIVNCFVDTSAPFT